MLTRTGEYALQAMVYLAQNQEQGPISGPRIAERLGIPQKYLSSVLGDLVRCGVLVSMRGKGGGFSLARRPKDIVLAQVLKPFEPILRHKRTPCPFGNPVCSDDDPCAGHDRWKPLKEAYARFLEGTSLNDVSQEGRPRSKKRTRRTRRTR